MFCIVFYKNTKNKLRILLTNNLSFDASYFSVSSYLARLTSVNCKLMGYLCINSSIANIFIKFLYFFLPIIGSIVCFIDINGHICSLSQFKQNHKLLPFSEDIDLTVRGCFVDLFLASHFVYLLKKQTNKSLSSTLFISSELNFDHKSVYIFNFSFNFKINLLFLSNLILKALIKFL